MKATAKGWVVMHEPSQFINDYSFERTRTDSIESFMSPWDPERTNWRKKKRQGYKCVKATLTIEVEHKTKDNE